jgi:hypothetical protein
MLASATGGLWCLASELPEAGTEVVLVDNSSAPARELSDHKVRMPLAARPLNYA